MAVVCESGFQIDVHHVHDDLFHAPAWIPSDWTIIMITVSIVPALVLKIFMFGLLAALIEL